MYIEERKTAAATILDCCGRFDEADQAPFIQTIEKLQSHGCRHLVINMTSLYHLDHRALDLLYFAHDFLQSNSGRLALVSPLSTVRNELDRANVPATIPTFASIYDALHREHVGTARLSDLIHA